MSEQEKPKSFMQELDEWTNTTVIEPLFDQAREFDDAHTYGWDKAVEDVKKAIRTKVLESYRNGQAAGPAKPRSDFKPRRQTNR